MLYNSIYLKAAEKGNKIAKKRNCFCLALCKDKATDGKDQIQPASLYLIPVGVSHCLQRWIGVQNQWEISRGVQWKSDQWSLISGARDISRSRVWSRCVYSRPICHAYSISFDEPGQWPCPAAWPSHHWRGHGHLVKRPGLWIGAWPQTTALAGHTGGISKSSNLGCEMTEELLAVLRPSSTIKNLPTPLNDLPPSFTEAEWTAISICARSRKQLRAKASKRRRPLALAPCHEGLSAVSLPPWWMVAGFRARLVPSQWLTVTLGVEGRGGITSAWSIRGGKETTPGGNSTTARMRNIPPWSPWSPAKIYCGGGGTITRDGSPGRTICWRLEIQAAARGAGHVGGMGERCWTCWDKTELGKCCSQVNIRDSIRQEEK